MPTVYTFLRISLLFILLYNANLIRADMVTYEAYGVKKGQKLDFRILERPERPEFTSGMEFPEE